MIRASFYLLAAGAIWFVEGFLFSRFLDFNAVQTGLAVVFYAALFGVVTTQLIRAMRRDIETGDTARWRYLSMAPMVTVILGSFVSLPIVLVIVIIGKLA
jgi:hypothetical protein